MIGGIGRDESIFVKTIFGVEESRVKVSHQLKTHTRSAPLVKVTPHLSVY